MSEYYYGITDPGKVRDNNEDAFFVEEQKGKGRVIAAVIDGVGGYEGGEVAAAIAKDCIEHLVAKSIDDEGALKAVLIDINTRIIEARASHKGKEKMACVLTLALADTETNQFYYAHVGDTRLYLLRGQSLVKVSKDHSFVGFLEESNRITEQNAMRHPKRNEVNKVLGSEPNIEMQRDYIDAGNSPFLPGDLLLLCSDGLTDMVGSQDITDVLTRTSTISEKAKALIDAANGAGGKDNVTVVLVQNPKAPQNHEPTLPVAKKETALKHDDAESYKTKSGNSPLVWLLSIACLGLAAALAWQYMKPKQEPVVVNAASTPQPVVAHRARNAAEQLLLDSLSQSANTLAIDTAVFRGPIIISDTVRIDKDSFHLSGNGLVLRGDTGLHGAGLILPPTARYILLEDVVFEHFPIAIAAANRALRLRNVRFRDCGTSVSYSFHFPEDYTVHGAILEGYPFKTDSLPVKP
jgi:serine/threonine protein phosphatase PrpC